MHKMNLFTQICAALCPGILYNSTLPLGTLQFSHLGPQTWMLRYLALQLWHMNALLLEIGSWAFQHFGTAILGKILNFTTSNPPPLPSCGWLCVLIRWFHSAVIHIIVVLSIGCLLDIFASHPYLWNHKLADKLVPIFLSSQKSRPWPKTLSLSLWGMPPLKSKDLVRNRNIHIANPQFCKAQRI